MLPLAKAPAEPTEAAEDKVAAPVAEAPEEPKKEAAEAKLSS